MGFVLDASTTLDWVFPAQRNGASESVIPALMRGFALAPAIWHFEVCAVLCENLKRKVLEPWVVSRFMAELDTYNIFLKT